MAEGGVSSSSECADKDLDSGGLVCDPCSEDGHKLSAVGYCVDCDEYLCDHCYQCHCVPRAFRSHVLKDAASMPRVRGEPTGTKPILKCPVHNEKEAVAYSKLNNTYYCGTCVSVLKGHKILDDIQSIEDLSKDIKNKEDFKTFTRKLDDTRNKYKYNKDRAMNRRDEEEKVYEDINARIAVKYRESIRNITRVIAQCDSAVETLSQWIDDKEQYQDESKCLFALMKLKTDELERMSRNCESIVKENRKEIQPVSQAKINDLFSYEPELMRPGKLIDQFTIKHADDSNPCSVIGMAFVGNDKLLVTDYHNYTLKLVNAKEQSIQLHTTLGSYPFEPAVTDDHQAYVAMPGQKKIFHLPSPTTNLTNYREIPTDGQCWTLAHHNKKLVCQFYTPCKIDERDVDGKVLREINTDISLTTNDNGGKVVAHPLHSVLDKRTGSMFVSCWNQNSISEITNTGQVKCIIQSAELKCPRGMVIDADDSILVCSDAGTNVFRVTRRGELKNDVLPKPLDFKPLSLAFDEVNRQLYVAGRCDSVSVYQI